MQPVLQKRGILVRRIQNQKNIPKEKWGGYELAENKIKKSGIT
jgi:hypothetical protein